MRVAAAILAGGRGSRLGGVAKGLVRVGGEPIVTRQLRALAPLVAERYVVAAEAETWAGVDARVLTDLSPGLGPLAGLEAALAATTAEAVLLFACDLPVLDAALVTALRDAPAAEAVVARLDGRAQPLAARYATSLLPRVRERLARRALKLLDFVAALDVRYVDFPAGTRALVNVNTPEDLARAESFAGG